MLYRSNTAKGVVGKRRPKQVSGENIMSYVKEGSWLHDVWEVESPADSAIRAWRQRGKGRERQHEEDQARNEVQKEGDESEERSYPLHQLTNRYYGVSCEPEFLDVV